MADRMQPQKIKGRVRSTIRKNADVLRRVSEEIHAHPEMAFEEYRASQLLAGQLAAARYDVALGTAGLDTAFVASIGLGPLTIAICAEYDALPDLGHACGHNLIAAAALGAAIGLSTVAADLPLRVLIVGTPAEEAVDGGGKILLLEDGVFRDVDAAMMVHPAPEDILAPVMTAASKFGVRYIGREAHAAAAPHTGINAADGMTLAQVAIGLLRQHLAASEQVHGIVTHAGRAPNVIPDLAEGQFIIRSSTFQAFEKLQPRIIRCFEAGALASGARLEIVGGDRPYREVRHDPGLLGVFRENAERLGRYITLPTDPSRPSGSTDMGNVSHVVPSIHPLLGVDAEGAGLHQKAFADRCVGRSADAAFIDGAIAMAWTAVDLALARDGTTATAVYG